MKKYNFKEVKVIWIDWKELNLWDVKLHEQIGNAIYAFSMDVNLAEIGARIYKGEEVELRDTDTQKIKEIINDEQKFAFIPLVKRSVVSFIDKK